MATLSKFIKMVTLRMTSDILFTILGIHRALWQQTTSASEEMDFKSVDIYQDEPSIELGVRQHHALMFDLRRKMWVGESPNHILNWLTDKYYEGKISHANLIDLTENKLHIVQLPNQLTN